MKSKICKIAAILITLSMMMTFLSGAAVRPQRTIAPLSNELVWEYLDVDNHADPLEIYGVRFTVFAESISDVVGYFVFTDDGYRVYQDPVVFEIADLNSNFVLGTIEQGLAHLTYLQDTPFLIDVYEFFDLEFWSDGDEEFAIANVRILDENGDVIAELISYSNDVGSGTLYVNGTPFDDYWDFHDEMEFLLWEVGENVTVTGEWHGIVNTGFWVDVPYGLTVTWGANISSNGYFAEESCIFVFGHGDFIFTGSIIATGHSAIGIAANSLGTIYVQGNATINVNGENSAIGILAYSGDIVVSGNAYIAATSENAFAILSLGYNTVTVQGAAFVGSNGDALDFEGIDISTIFGSGVVNILGGTVKSTGSNPFVVVGYEINVGVNATVFGIGDNIDGLFYGDVEISDNAIVIAWDRPDGDGPFEYEQGTSDDINITGGTAYWDTLNPSGIRYSNVGNTGFILLSNVNVLTGNDDDCPTFPDAWRVRTPATCTEEGLEYRICTTCGALEETRVIPALGHNWGEWENDERACEICGEVETREPGTGDDDDDNNADGDNNNDTVDTSDAGVAMWIILIAIALTTTGATVAYSKRKQLVAIYNNAMKKHTK